MTKNPETRIATLLCAVMLVVPALSSAQAPPAASASGLRIVVIAGEDAINIIQQKTAVNPIVEVRDRNNLPVSGVAVTFSVGGQGASFAGGASTLTLTTNAAGQAVVTGLTPTASGALTINASAIVNGQTIAATITQTNFATAAEAASAAAGGAGGSGAGGGTGAGAGGGGVGGMSGATLGIVGGGIAAAGAVLATTVGGGSDSPATSTGTSGNTGGGTTAGPAPGPGPAAPTTTNFTGTFNGPYTVTSSFDGLTCSITFQTSGTARLALTTSSTGTVTGTFDANGTQTQASSQCFGFPLPNVGGPFVWTAPATGSSGSIRAVQDLRQSQTVPGGSFTATGSITFTGSLSGGVVTGNIVLNQSVDIRIDGDPEVIKGTSQGTFAVTMR